MNFLDTTTIHRCDYSNCSNIASQTIRDIGFNVEFYYCDLHFPLYCHDWLKLLKQQMNTIEKLRYREFIKKNSLLR